MSSPTASTSHGTIASDERQAHRRSGWVAGILGGILIVLLAFPSSRYTLLSQLQFALAERSLPYLHAMMVRPGGREISLLDRVASASPDDYLMQVGRATVLADQGGLQPRQRFDNNRPDGDNTLYRLGAVVARFPQVPGAYAHLSRYMMTDRIRLERPELPLSSINRTGDDAARILRRHVPGAGLNQTDRPSGTPTGNSVPPAHLDPDDVRMMEWALRAGERRDPDNAFWPAMLATTYFSVKRDIDGVEALRRASEKVRWDAYIYEEVLGEWRLYSAAYGNNGAIQKIGPLSLVSFPHLGEIRKMAQFVRYLADQAERDGNDTRAIELRRELLLLGSVMTSKAQWAYEALIGTDVCMIAGTDSESKVMPGSIRSMASWQAQAPDYIALLKRRGRISEMVWMRNEIESCCRLRNRIDLARYDASYPGIPPGIPLTPLFGSWMACVCVIQELLTLLAVLGLVRTLESLRRRSNTTNSAAARLQNPLLIILCGAWIASTLMATSGVPSTRFMLLFLLLTALDVILILDAVRTARSRKALRSAQSQLNSDRFGLDGGQIAQMRKWSLLTTVTLSALVVCPALICITLFTPLLSAQHPVAAALTSLVDLAHNVTTSEALQVALFGTLVPLTALIGLAVPALVRKQLMLPRVCQGMMRLAAPTVVILALAYVVMLDRTIALDGEASRAISDAARNDLQWMLTHSGDPPQPQGR